jgi:ATP-citrate lyase alpha-subunit
MDYADAVKRGLVRKPTSIVSTICDERGDVHDYCGVPIDRVLEEGYGIGGVIGLLWFKKKLPPHACRFLEMVVQIIADHGPAVAGAHNTIVTARAGKDLISSLVSGLVTIGPRFGGAVNGAADHFRMGLREGLAPREFVDAMKARGETIQGIGHRLHSVENPDARVELMIAFARQHFAATPTLDYALAVAGVTSKKKSNLILNVDGCIGVLFVDLLNEIGYADEDVQRLTDMGFFNAIFLLGRSIGFMGHYFDQRRLDQPLYRHPLDDILYDVPDEPL